MQLTSGILGEDLDVGGSQPFEQSFQLNKSLYSQKLSIRKQLQNNIQTVLKSIFLSWNGRELITDWVKI